MKTRPRNKNLFRNRRGTVAVEISLLLPILLMFLFGCYEIGRANMLLHATESAAYEGARVGIVPGAKPERVREAAHFILRSVGIEDFEIIITPSVITTETEKVKVEVIVPFNSNTNLPQMFFDDPKFRGQCELNRELL
jgi:hypothetical protein